MVEYAFYTETYKGSSVSADEWPLFEKRAAEKLAHYKRIYAVTAPDDSAEAMATCAMADSLAYFTAAQNGVGGAVTAASIGSVSVSYQRNDAVDLSPRGQERELMRCAKLYLEIYRGVY